MVTAKAANNKMILDESSLKNLLGSIRDLKFGEIIIKIQDSRIVQIERLEKFRLNKADSKEKEAKE